MDVGSKTSPRTSSSSARTYEQVVKEKKERKHQTVKESKAPLDRYVRSQFRSDIRKIDRVAAHFKKLNGTKVDLARDDPSRVVLEDSSLLSPQLELAAKVGRAIFSPMSFGPIASVTGVAFIDEQNEITKLDCKIVNGNTRSDRIRIDLEDRKIDFERIREDGQECITTRGTGDRDETIRYYFHRPPFRTPNGGGGYNMIPAYHGAGHFKTPWLNR